MLLLICLVGDWGITHVGFEGLFPDAHWPGSVGGEGDDLVVAILGWFEVVNVVV